jgi:hypothetical protein
MTTATATKEDLFGTLVTYHGSIAALAGETYMVRRSNGDRYDLIDPTYPDVYPLSNVRRASFTPQPGNPKATMCRCGHDVTRHSTLTCTRGVCAACDA